VVACGGHLILYEQDRDYYPHVGTPGVDEKRRADLAWDDAWKVVEGFGNAKLVSASRHNESNEYSWQLIIQKTSALVDKPRELLISDPLKGAMVFPRTKRTYKEALVIRYGALGDALWVTPVVRKLKEEGYHVVLNCTEYSAQVYRENPNIDEFMIHHGATDVPYSELDAYWEYMSQGFEKVVNLTKTIEGALVKCEGSDEYDWPHEKRHKECNVNFQDRTMAMAGFPEAKGELPELYFSDIEEHLAKNFTHAYRDNFVILVGLSGSGFHKTYPWWEYVATEICRKYKDVRIITVGDESCKVLEGPNSSHPNIVHKSGILTVRQSYILTKYANLVLGPDTGLMNAASCFSTPKIILMSTNSDENLCKYWKNCISLHADDCECHPCHRLIYSNNCPRGTIQGIAPKCMENIKPEAVMEAFETFYSQWEKDRIKEKNKLRFAAFTIADSPLTWRLARRTEASFKNFHPDVPFLIFDPKNEQAILGEVKNSACACKAFEIRPRLMANLLKKYDGVIYLDADTVVTHRLDEFLEGDYDVAGSLNLKGLSDDPNYLNAGVGACRSKKFCEEWTELMYAPDAGPSNQVYFNQLANSKRYLLKVVDRGEVYYNETSRPHWKDIVRNNGHLECNGRIVKVLHWAGGIGRMENKLSSKDFTPEVREFLDDVTDTTDFTEIEGEEVSQWS
jgi:ADP-heptose:LPS heptosyltransferase